MTVGIALGRSAGIIQNMPKRSSKSRPTDPNELAARIVEEATEGKAEAEPASKNPHPVALGRRLLRQLFTILHFIS